VFVAEGDESDAAILAYTPVGAVVTNVEADHLDFFGTPEAYVRVFDDFLDRVQRPGFVVCVVDDPGARRVADAAEDRGLDVCRVGLSGGPGARDYEARVHGVDGAGAGYQLWIPEGREGAGVVGEVRLRLPGTHYVLDSLAALCAGLRIGFPFADLAAGLAAYGGSGRRMELKGTAAGVTVYDSYAHHPTEIRGDLEAARELVGGAGRLVVCFQPHLFSRTRVFAADMGVALGAADEVIVMDVYPSRELPEPGVDGSLVAAAVTLPREHVVYEPDWDRAASRVVERARPGDLVLTLGAGNVTEIGPRVLALLQAGSTADGPGDGPDQGGAR
jgi:UDP-N-acetylmuramate--alanine ligase